MTYFLLKRDANHINKMKVIFEYHWKPQAPPLRQLLLSFCQLPLGYFISCFIVCVEETYLFCEISPYKYIILYFILQILILTHLKFLSSILHMSCTLIIPLLVNSWTLSNILPLWREEAALCSC